MLKVKDSFNLKELTHYGFIEQNTQYSLALKDNKTTFNTYFILVLKKTHKIKINILNEDNNYLIRVPTKILKDIYLFLINDFIEFI